MDQRFENFATQFTRINRAMQRIKTQGMAPFGLKGVHVMCLAQLGQHPHGVTATELASLCVEDKAAISRALRELEEKGLVMREGGSGQSGYRSTITLTESGQHVCREMDVRIEEAVALATTGLEERELATFRQTLVNIADNLES